MKKTDDYELYDKDFDEFIRRGMESFGMQDHPGREGYKKHHDRLDNLKK